VYFFNILALDTESLKDDSSSTLQEGVVSSDGIAELEETSPKRICIGISDCTSSRIMSPTAVAGERNEVATESSATKLSTQDTSSETSFSSSHVPDVRKHSQVSSRKASHSEAQSDVGRNESFSAKNNSSDPDVSRRRNLRCKLSTDQYNVADFLDLC